MNELSPEQFKALVKELTEGLQNYARDVLPHMVGTAVESAMVHVVRELVVRELKAAQQEQA